MAITLQAPPGQPLDAELTALAGLTSAADKGIQFTGAGTAGLFDLTTAGKALLDDADATAQRVTLGLAIGTNVQAFSSTLATLASSTAAGLALMDDADATAQRATLGLVIGTDVQAFSADLADIAAIADAQGDIIVRGAAGWERLAKSATATDVLTAGASQPAWAAPTGGGSVATDAIWDAAGDLAVGTGANTAARLAMGTGLQTLRVNAGATALEWATPAGGVTDGDKGDITVSGGGAAWAIDNDVVTNAKAANMATATIKGRLTAATGDPEDLTQAQTRTVLALTPGTDVQAFSAVLAATTASFLTADETKLDGIEALADVTDAANVNAAGAVMESDYNANTILAATADNTPLPITMGASTILARLAAGDIIASTPSQMRTLLGLVIGTDVQAFSATLSTLASSTAAGLALMDDADATAQRTTLGLAIGTNVQAFDADLAAIAGLTSAADKGIQFTGVGTAATFDLTTAGKALLDDANNTVQRATLGLVIGTDVQAQDAELSAIAGLTSAADRLPYFTGSGTAALATFTTFARSILDDANAAAVITTLGLPAAQAGDRIALDVVTDPTKILIDVVLAAGVSGGDTLTGGTAASENLLLASTEHATQGSVLLLGSDPTYTATPVALFGTAAASTITANYASQRLPTGISLAGTRVMTTAGQSGTVPNTGFEWAVIYKNASGILAHLTASGVGIGTLAFYDVSVTKADAETPQLGNHHSFRGKPTFQGINGGNFAASSAYVGHSTAPTITDCTLAAYTAFGCSGVTLSGSGALTLATALSIPSAFGTGPATSVGVSIGSGLTTGITNSSPLTQIGTSAFTGAITITDVNVALGTTTGTKFGTATTQKLSFFNSTPIVQPSAYTQTFSTANKTHAARTATTLTDNTAGTATTTLEALTSGSVYATDVAAIRNNFADLAAMVNKLIVDLADTAEFANALCDDQQALGLAA